MASILLAIFGKSWKSSTMGYIFALWGLYQGFASGGMDWKHAVTAAFGALLGRILKDGNVTGGTVPATHEAENRTTSTASATSVK